MKKYLNRIPIILLTVCITLLYFLTPLNAWADSPGITDTLNSNTDVLKDIDQFLKTMPNNYYTVRTIEQLKGVKNAVLIDVRKPSEYKGGHIPKAINIPLEGLTENLEQIPTDLPVIVYCSSGYRSAMAVVTLRLLGYNNVRGFPPSIQGWKAAGETLER